MRKLVKVQLDATDRTRARIVVGSQKSDLDHRDAEALAWQLISTREAMLPRRRPGAVPGLEIPVPEGAELLLAQPGTPDRGLLALMHPGLGWIGFQFDQDEARTMIRKLQAFVDGQPRPWAA